jgi:glyoxylase-like metal-dependent hydrolase (beta-lactamase superfamily II)
METAVPGLCASLPQALPFAPVLDIRAFLLERQQGNVLVYSVDGLRAEEPSIEDLGGVSRQYLGHRHEAMFASDRIAAPLFTHENERDSVAAAHRVRGTFSRRHTLDGDFEVIPTPGHTSGATTYLWDSGQHRLLFTGDTIYLDDDEWVAAVLPGSSDRAAYVESLAAIRELDFDVLVPWAATGGRLPYAFTDRKDARRRIDAVMERVRRGEAR